MSKHIYKSLAEHFPESVKLWHTTKNSITPFEISYGSGKTFWFICELGHEWQNSPSKFSRGDRCPYCSNHKVSTHNSLEINYPEISKLWHPTKNKLSPKEVSFGSSKKVWWNCHIADDHEYKMRISDKTLNKQGCPCCAGKQIVLSTSLYIKVPKIAKFWDENKNKLSPKEVGPGSTAIAWWKCPVADDHEWQARINSMSMSAGCLCCRGKVLVPSRTLKSQYPEICKLWNYEKNELTPEKISPYSGRKIWWKCFCGHEWKTAVNNLTYGGFLCRKCKNNTSVNTPTAPSVLYLICGLDQVNNNFIKCGITARSTKIRLNGIGIKNTKIIKEWTGTWEYLWNIEQIIKKSTTLDSLRFKPEINNGFTECYFPEALNELQRQIEEAFKISEINSQVAIAEI